MHSDWRNFLQRQGAVFDADRVLHFGNTEAELHAAMREVVIADLSGDHGVIAVEGSDARGFLQGQLSTNVLTLTSALSQFSSWSNAKGRVVTTMRIFERGDRILLLLPQVLAATVVKRLSMYVLRAKAKLTDASDMLSRFGLAGGRVPELLAACGLTMPAQINDVTDHQGVQIIRLHGTPPRCVVLGETTQLQALWTGLREQGAHPVGSNAWTLLRILAGEPCMHVQTSEQFVAQMLRLEELGALHFNKGCYLGQEVIARAHYRGTVKRHLYNASCNSVESLQPGTDIQPKGDEQPAGEVVDACRDAHGVWQMLIVLKDESITVPLQINGSPVRLITGN